MRGTGEGDKGTLHFPYELLLCFRTEVAMDGRLDLVEVLDHIFQAVCVA